MRVIGKTFRKAENDHALSAAAYGPALWAGPIELEEHFEPDSKSDPPIFRAFEGSSQCDWIRPQIFHKSMNSGGRLQSANSTKANRKSHLKIQRKQFLDRVLHSQYSVEWSLFGVLNPSSNLFHKQKVFSTLPPQHRLRDFPQPCSNTWSNPDAHLRRLVGEYGPKWKLISKSLGEFTDLDCKHWWLFLSNYERLR
jgi:hypothetical protein